MPESTAETNGPLWSGLAKEYAELWGELAAPARERIAKLTGIGAGVRVLDAGCGPGQFCALAVARGAQVSGVDAAPGMIELARGRAPLANLRIGALERLPWPGDAFDVVTAFNALQFAADALAATRELRRVLRPGGLLAICNWSREEDCSVRVVERALADLQPVAAAGEPRRYRLTEPGGIEALVRDAGLRLQASEEIATPYEVPGPAVLFRAFAWGEDELIARIGAERVRNTIATAAEPFRRPDGSYRFDNRFRLVVARRAGEAA
jgi:SAM-dependent methyltransferase